MLSLKPLTFRLKLFLLQATCLTFGGCKTAENSNPSVYGGKEDYSILPRSLGLVEVINGVPGQHPFCTGGFITDRLFLTAAHCIFEGKEVAIVSEAAPFKGKFISSKTFFAAPEYLRRRESTGPFIDATAVDIGFVIFPQGTAPAALIMEIAPIPPKVGDGVQLVGWGANRQKDFEDITFKRHYGRNKIAKIDEKNGDKIVLVGITYTDGAPDDVDHASAGSGDSGGPLFNDKDQVIGVTSNIGTLDEKDSDTRDKILNNTSSYANLNFSKTRDIIDAIVAQYRSKANTN